MANMKCSITLCKVPITPTQQLDFTSKTAQKNYFQNNAVVEYPNCKYQPRTGNLRVKGYVDELQEANYGFYTNTYKGTTKTFYFWIVAKNLVAKETTELTIQIDVFQTWLFDFYQKPCMIEREHVADDTIGAHTLPEDFELGDYITHNKKQVECLCENPCFLVGTTDESFGGIFGKTYSGFAIRYYDFNDADKLSEYIQQLCEDGKGDAIAFIFTFPSGLLSDINYDSGDKIPAFYDVITKDDYYLWEMADKDFNYKGKSWTPYNNKLFTYPFNFITIKNSSGGNVVLKWENFDNLNEVKFQIQSVLVQNPTITLTPCDYSGKSFAIDDSISLSDYGLCSWNNDNYANWYAQHVNSINAQSMNAGQSYRAKQFVNDNSFENALSRRDTNALKGAINTTLSTANALGSGNLFGAVGNAVGGASNTYLDYGQATKNATTDLQNANLLNTTNYQNEIRSLVASVKDAQVQPNTAKGDTSSCGLDMARDTATFFIEQTMIKPEYAKIIDMYFQMFGYQVNEIKKPSFQTREKWNYIKTVNCCCYGEIPHEDTDALNDIFNNGLTVWHDESYMFNYNTLNDFK